MLATHIYFNGNCKEAIELYEKAFNTRADAIFRNDDGMLVHAEMHIHEQRVMLNNRFGNKDKTTVCAIIFLNLMIT